MIDFIQSETQFFILCLTTLFTLINPIGIAPLLMVMTERFSKDERVKIAKKGSATALITLLLFELGLGLLYLLFIVFWILLLPLTSTFLLPLLPLI